MHDLDPSFCLRTLGRLAGDAVLCFGWLRSPCLPTLFTSPLKSVAFAANTGLLWLFIPSVPVLDESKHDVSQFSSVVVLFRFRGCD